MSCSSVQTTLDEGNSLRLRAHIHGLNQVAITIASVTSIMRTIRTIDDGLLVGAAESLVVATTITNTLNTGEGWEATTAAPGSNFDDTMSGATYFTSGGHDHQIKYVLVMASGPPIVFHHNVSVYDLAG